MIQKRAAPECQHQHDYRCHQCTELRPAAGLDHYGSTWGAGVDRKGSQEGGDEITYAQAEKVAINVRRAFSWTPERICHRCRLHHDHERDDWCQWCELPQKVEVRQVKPR